MRAVSAQLTKCRKTLRVRRLVLEGWAEATMRRRSFWASDHKGFFDAFLVELRHITKRRSVFGAVEASMIIAFNGHGRFNDTMNDCDAWLEG